MVLKKDIWTAVQCGSCTPLDDKDMQLVDKNVEQLERINTFSSRGRHHSSINLFITIALLACPDRSPFNCYRRSYSYNPSFPGK